MRSFKKHLTPLPEEGKLLPLKNSTPLDLEIGCGQGWHAFQRALHFPERNLLAIEKTRKRFQQFLNLLKKEHHPKNLWPLHTNAVWWLSHFGKPHLFENIFLLYPNPYPKPRQKNLRWIHRPFMTYLLSLLKPKGVLELRTNKQLYSSDFQAQLKKYPNVSLLSSKVLTLSHSPQTLFEKKYLERNELCYQLKLEKIY